MQRAIRTVMKKELIQTFRDRRMIAILFIAPMFQTTVFGFAVNLDLKAQPTVIVDEDRTDESRRVADLLSNSDSFTLQGTITSAQQAEKLMLDGAISTALMIPKGFGEKSGKGEAELLVVQDGSDANTAVRAGQEIAELIGHDVQIKREQRIAAALASVGLPVDGVIPRAVLEWRAYFNPGLTTAVFLVPGVLAMVLLLITVMLTSMGLTREKELGTLEQIMVTPLRPIELIIGKTIPFALLGLVDVVLVLSIAVLVFDVPVRGSVLLLFGASAVFLMTTLGLGLFVSTVSATQQQAMMNTFFIMLPSLMLSGFIFPVEHMPPFARFLCQLNPLTYFIEIARGIMIKGSTVSDLWSQLGILLLMGFVVLAGASLRFKKRMA